MSGQCIAVMSGKGGDLLLETYNKVMESEYPALAKVIHVALPDEKFRRVGQSLLLEEDTRYSGGSGSFHAWLQ